MHERFKLAALKGIEIKREKSKKELQESQKRFWMAVSAAEEWVTSERGLSKLIKDHAKNDFKRICISNYSPGEMIIEDHYRWEFYVCQARTAGIRVDKEEENYYIEISQFLQEEE